MENHDCCLCHERVGTIKYRKHWYCNDCYELFVVTGNYDDTWVDHMSGSQAADDDLDGLLEPTGDEMWDDVKDAFRRDRE